MDKYYIGESSNVDNRLDLHNNHYYKRAYSSISDDWTIVLQYECNSKKEAIYLERFIKRMKSRKFIEKIITESNILTERFNRSKKI
ncbi:MAG: GIY-YIG nuclease family protein [Chitinophagales bacterium]|nr:GIY-YIG nuclease family protein [Chitinophagales bacterium]